MRASSSRRTGRPRRRRRRPPTASAWSSSAGVTAAEFARRQSADLAITVVHKEPQLPYNRLNLTRLLAGEVAAGEIDLHEQAWYRDQRIELLAGEAAGIDLQASEVALADGQRVAYDRLILANGAHPFVPPIVGAAREGVQPLRTREQVLGVLERARPGSRCVCIGGGLLGLEAAGGLCRRGVEVTVLEGFDWLLPRQLAEPAAAHLQRHLEGLGIAVHCGARVAEIAGDETVRAVRLEDGQELGADAVILATGVRPNSYLARLCGLEVKGGVVVDDHMATSAAGVFAAGDVTEHRGVVYGLWPAAIAQGRVAGSNAGGGDAVFTGLPPATQLKVLEVEMFSIGDFVPRDGASRVIERDQDGRYLRLVCRDGALVGANLYGDISLAGEVRSAIEDRSQIADLAELQRRVPELARG
jgi:nitrite reductase (NADH) large subunit